MRYMVVITAALLALCTALVCEAQTPQRVVVYLPAHHRTAVQAAFRVELASGTGTTRTPEFRELTQMGDELAARSATARTQLADDAAVIWFEFPSGILAPAEIRVWQPGDPAPRYAMLPLAYDVAEPRLIAMTASRVLHQPPQPFEAAIPQVAVSAAPVAAEDVAVDTESNLVATEDIVTTEQAQAQPGNTVRIHDPSGFRPAVRSDWRIGFDFGLGYLSSHFSNGTVSSNGTVASSASGAFTLEASVSFLLRDHGARLSYVQTVAEDARFVALGIGSGRLLAHRSIADLRYLTRLWGTDLDPVPRLFGSVAWSLFGSIGVYGEYGAYDTRYVTRLLDVPDRLSSLHSLGGGVAGGFEFAVHFGMLKLGLDLSGRFGVACTQIGDQACGGASARGEYSGVLNVGLMHEPSW